MGVIRKDKQTEGKTQLSPRESGVWKTKFSKGQLRRAMLSALMKSEPWPREMISAAGWRELALQDSQPTKPPFPCLVNGYKWYCMKCLFGSVCLVLAKW